MKRFIFLFLMVASIASAQQTNRTQILRGYLSSDFDANNKRITNAISITASNVTAIGITNESIYRTNGDLIVDANNGLFNGVALVANNADNADQLAEQPIYSLLGRPGNPVASFNGGALTNVTAENLDLTKGTASNDVASVVLDIAAPPTNFLNAPGGSGGAGIGVLNTNGSAYALTFEWRTNLTERRYNVKDFGAVGDGLIANGCFATNGSRIVTCTNAPFVAGDAGKVFSLYFAGTNGAQNWTAGISNVISSTQIELSNAVVYNATNEPAVYGTEDGYAISNALFFCASNGLRLFFPKGIYVVNLPLSTGNRTNSNLAQLWVPPMPHSLQRSKAFLIEGVDDTYGAHVDAPPSGEHMMEIYGSVIWSTLPYGPDGLNYGSVLDFRDTSRNGGVFSEGIAANTITPYIKNMNFRAAFNCNLKIVNMGGTYSGIIEQTTVDTGFGQGALNGKALPALTGTNLSGIVMSQANNDNNVALRNVSVYFCYNGVEAGENANANEVKIYACENAVYSGSGGGTMQFWRGLNIQECHRGFVPGAHQMRIMADVALYNYGFRYTTNLLINDPNGGMEGSFIRAYQQGNSPHISATPANSVVIGTPNTIMVELHNNVDAVDYPTVWIGNRRLLSQMLFDGVVGMKDSLSITNGLKWSALRVGGDFDAKSLTANTQKYFSFNMIPYENTVFWPDAGATVGPLAMMAFRSLASDTILYLGSDPFGARGATKVALMLAPTTDGTVAQQYLLKSGGFQLATNAIANWPSAADTGGGAAMVNSNGTIYLLTSTPNSTAWAATNKLAP